MWRWLPAGAALVAALPAIVAAGVVDVGAGAALGIGMIPALVVGIPAQRRKRIVILVAALVLGVPILVGASVSPWPLTALATLLLLPPLAVFITGRARAQRLSTLLVVLAPALIGVGLSLDGFTSGLRVTALFIAGSIVTFAVAIALPPAWLAAPAPRADPPTPTMAYACLVGLVGAITAGIGYALDFDHVGWACAAALLVMRPQARLQEWRTAGRFCSVCFGAVSAGILIEFDCPPWGIAVAIGLALTLAAGTRGSRWYILPTFTTFLVITLISYPDAETAAGRVAERVGETVLGLVVATVVGFGVPALGRRWRRHRSSPEEGGAVATPSGP